MTAPLFEAILRKRRVRWPWALAACALVVAVGVLFARRTGGRFRVMTGRGFQLLRPGMSTGQVRSVMGMGPIAQNLAPDGAECLMYGHPTLKQPRFTVYEACYQEGALVRVTEKELSAEAIDPDALRRALVP